MLLFLSRLWRDSINIQCNEDLIHANCYVKQRQLNVLTIFVGPANSKSTNKCTARKPQKRENGKFVKTKAGKSKRRHPGIGRPCPFCKKYSVTRKLWSTIYQAKQHAHTSLVLLIWRIGLSNMIFQKAFFRTCSGAFSRSITLHHA